MLWSLLMRSRGLLSVSMAGGKVETQFSLRCDLLVSFSESGAVSGQVSWHSAGVADESEARWAIKSSVALLTTESTGWGVEDFGFNRQHPSFDPQGREISGEDIVDWGVEKDVGLSRDCGRIIEADSWNSDLDHLPVRSQGFL